MKLVTLFISGLMLSLAAHSVDKYTSSSSPSSKNLGEESGKKKQKMEEDLSRATLDEWRSKAWEKEPRAYPESQKQRTEKFKAQK